MVIATSAHRGPILEALRLLVDGLFVCCLLLPIGLIVGLIICSALRAVVVAFMWFLEVLEELGPARQESSATELGRADELQRGQETLRRVEASGDLAIAEMQRYADGDLGE